MMVLIMSNCVDTTPDGYIAYLKFRDNPKKDFTLSDKTIEFLKTPHQNNEKHEHLIILR